MEVSTEAGATIRCRPMHERDMAGVAALSVELGYPAEPSDVHRRFNNLLARIDNGLFVAVSEPAQSVCGWLHVYGVRLLETDGYAEIGGIVVTQIFRKRGIGRSLLRMSETWACDHGYDQVRLRSGLHRDEAHRFYVAVGYEQSNASYMFKRNTAPKDVANVH